METKIKEREEPRPSLAFLGGESMNKAGEHMINTVEQTQR